jgi:hypothetical protein
MDVNVGEEENFFEEKVFFLPHTPTLFQKPSIKRTFLKLMSAC